MTSPDDVEREFERQARLVSQLLTMHSSLRDRYRLLSKAVTLVIMSLSAISLAFAFASSSTRVRLLGVDASITTWLGVSALVLFVGSIFQLVFDWGASAGAHSEAVARLGSLRGSFASVRPGQEDFEVAAAELAVGYFGVLAGIPAIPERSFNRLKAKHLRKVELSKLISANPGTPLPLLRWRLYRSSATKSGT